MDDDGGMDEQGQRPNPFAGGRWEPPAGETQEPALTSVPDRGSPGAAMLAGFAVIALVLSTFVMQQISAAGKAEPTKVVGIAPPRADDTEALTLKMVMKMGQWFKTMAPAGGGGAAGPEQMLATNADAVQRPENRLRAAVVVAEVAGASEAETRLVTLRDALEDPGDLRLWKEMPPDDRRVLAEDARALIEHYKGDTSLSSSAIDELVKRHGYFGKVAGVWGRPDSDAERSALLGGGGALMAVLFAFGAVVVLVILGGLAAFVTMLVLVLSGRVRSRFVPPVPGGSVYIETVAMFFLGFVLLHVGMGVVVSQKLVSETNSFYVSIAAQWALLPIIAWPVVRGTGLTRWRRDIGLHSGEGVFKELFCGVAGYLAGVPVLLFAAVVSFVAVAIKTSAAGGTEPPAMENPIVELVSKGGAAPWLLFALATVWAPLVEECVFRGALFRHLRRRLGLVLTAIVVAVVFGTAHGYEWMMLGPVIALGFNFSLMREWRGSLIGPIFAHFLHNATVLLLVISLFTMLRD